MGKHGGPGALLRSLGRGLQDMSFGSNIFKIHASDLSYSFKLRTLPMRSLGL